MWSKKFVLIGFLMLDSSKIYQCLICKLEKEQPVSIEKKTYKKMNGHTQVLEMACAELYVCNMYCMGNILLYAICTAYIQCTLYMHISIV